MIQSTSLGELFLNRTPSTLRARATTYDVRESVFHFKEHKMEGARPGVVTIARLDQEDLAENVVVGLPWFRGGGHSCPE